MALETLSTMDADTLPALAAAATVILVGVAEWVHARRVRRMSRLAFGPSGRARSWTQAVPLFRVVAMGLLAWSFAALLLYVPKEDGNAAQVTVENKDLRHVVFVLDVSPSMILAKDAGEKRDLTRRQRTEELVLSMMERMVLSHCRFSLVAFHNTAITIVKDCFDLNVIKNLLDPRLPLINCFSPGKTMLLDGISQAMEVAKEWPPESTTIIIISDGDTVPDQGIPDVPKSIADVLVVGVGSIGQGQMIDDHSSRQDKATLNQVARRLQGRYVNCNTTHVPSESIESLTRMPEKQAGSMWDRRRAALVLMTIGGCLLAFLPLFLRYFGTEWTSESGVDARLKRSNGGVL